jgi:hypothetical protein
MVEIQEPIERGIWMIDMEWKKGMTMNYHLYFCILYIYIWLYITVSKDSSSSKQGYHINHIW